VNKSFRSRSSPIVVHCRSDIPWSHSIYFTL